MAPVKTLAAAKARPRRAAGGTKKIGSGDLGKRSGAGGKFSPGAIYVPPVDSGAFVTPSGDSLWYPWAVRPKWLDGSLPGDRGFDPFGLSKPAEYVQVEIDSLDGSKAVNEMGGVVGKYNTAELDGDTSTINPFAETFGLLRFRECEVLHGRWCMLAIVGMIWSELVTGIPWNQAGAAELDGGQYANFSLPIPLYSVAIIQALLVGGAEILRNNELDLEKRLYPGGAFDPLGYSTNPKALFNLKTAEIKHSRLAMCGVFFASCKALFGGEGIFA